MYIKEIIQIENITVEELKNELIIEFKQLLKSFLEQQEKADELLTRQETANILKVSLVTLWDWTKKDVLPAYRIGYKVRYKKSEVLESLKKINRFK
ncbi:helix-turn-helix domain-containing protein [uncultured Flavobacterium sp.]|uniref:helix-turn-helix domain-containing protein n=1 Tax=uncultured Flavobacterium sp. TaxID=165435 RepID=UPI0030EC18A7